MRFQTSRVFQVKYRCVLAAVVLLFSFFTRAKKKILNKNEQKKEGLFDERKGGSSRHIFILSTGVSTGVTHTHVVFLAPAQNKEREREREAERREALFFLSTIQIRRRCGNKNDSSLFFPFFCSFLRRCAL